MEYKSTSSHSIQLQHRVTIVTGKGTKLNIKPHFLTRYPLPKKTHAFVSNCRLPSNVLLTPTEDSNPAAHKLHKVLQMYLEAQKENPISH